MLSVMLFSGLISSAWSLAASANAGGAKQIVPSAEPHRNDYIPIAEQPFYNELERRYNIWTDNPIGEVIGNTAQETLLNFYAVMAIVGNRADEISQSYKDSPGLFWNEETKHEIENIEHLFEVAVKALDASQFPESVRGHLADESAIEIKHLLDYVFYTSIEPIKLFEGEAKQDIVSKSLDKAFIWRLPGTPISLTNRQGTNDTGFGYLFSAETTKNASQMYKEIYPRLAEMTGSKYKTPTFYKDFIHTPGHLVPPKWYVSIPTWGHDFLEQEVLGGETIFQTIFGLIALITYGFALSIVGTYSLKKFAALAAKERPIDHSSENGLLNNSTNLASTYWKISLSIAPIVVLTKFVEIFIDDYLNFTGAPLIIITFLFEIIYFSLLVFLTYITLEAIGRSLRHRMHRLDNKSSSQILARRRQISLIMPVCRTLAVASSVGLIYRLLLMLGLSPSAVLALSAVPGLAIGLGASKLLGNLFAGLSIQADQHLRIGELCRVGDATGFVRKIGLRSIEIQTQDSIITIPNAAADENTIQNYSKQLGNQECQGLSLNIDITDKLTTLQISELIRLTRSYLTSQQAFVSSFVSINRKEAYLVLDIYCLLKTKDLDTWPEYIELREAVLKRTLQYIDQVRLSRQILRLGLRTPADLIEKFPSILEEIVQEDPMLKFNAAHLRISDDCYNFILCYKAQHDTHRGFMHALNHLNERIIRKYEELSLQIPYPTTKFISTVNES